MKDALHFTITDANLDLSMRDFPDCIREDERIAAPMRQRIMGLAMARMRAAFDISAYRVKALKARAAYVRAQAEAAR